MASPVSPVRCHEHVPQTSPMLFQPSADERTLHDVNGEIKSTLTQLLNCGQIREDPEMRFWIQTRLMDTELQRRRYRRRRLSVPTILVTPRPPQSQRRVSA